MRDTIRFATHQDQELADITAGVCVESSDSRAGLAPGRQSDKTSTLTRAVLSMAKARAAARERSMILPCL
jgi:hypothetical protein